MNTLDTRQGDGEFSLKAHINRLNPTDLIRDIVKNLQDNPLAIRDHVQVIAELNSGGTIDGLNAVWPHVQRALREQKLYGGDGYRANVAQEVERLTKLFVAVLGDSSGAKN